MSVLTGNNVINYTSRTYNTILNDINSNPDLADKPDWFSKEIAGVGDSLFMNLNAQANNSYLRTSFTRRATQDLLNLIDYQMSPQNQAAGNLMFYILRSASFPVVLAQGDLSAATKGTMAQAAYTYNARSGITINTPPQNTVTGVNTTTDVITTNAAGALVTGDLLQFSSSGSLPSPLAANTDYYVITPDGTNIELATSLANAFAGIYINLTTVGSGTITSLKYSFIVPAWNEVYIADYINVAQGDGSDWQEYQLPDTNILEGSVSVELNGVGGWSQVVHWIDAGSSTLAFKLYYDSNNDCILAFGGGGYGVPPNGAITVYYATGGGILSNVSNLNRIVNYLGGNANITGVTNVTTFTGGSDPESVQHAKALAPALLYATEDFVTVNDGIALAESYSGVANVNIIRNFYGALSCQVPVVPTGGGTPSGTLLSALQAYLISKTTLQDINVICVAPNYSVVNLVGTASILTGYVWSTVLAYLTLALQLLFTERGAEIIDVYNESGIAAAVAVINAQFSSSFSTGDYSTITAMIEELTHPISLYSQFGISPTLFSIYSYCGTVVPGLKGITISSPSFPLSLSTNQIIQIGTIAITQVS